MKTFVSIIFCVSLLLTSCGNNQSKKESANDTDELINKSLETNNFKEAKDCDEFIDQYEKWMDNYIVLIEKYMKNPMDAELMQEYMKVAQESMNWMNQWNNKLSSCASKEKYEKRFEEITEKAEKKLKEMGIE
ncbi:MAG: hypothetical protein GQ525_06955 [Draconibacterium sp.]|nr:hypothetical protein [Draconibacterium sp.]